MILAVVAFMAPTASQVVANVQAHYAKLPQLTMDFDQKVTNVTFGSTKTNSGTMFLAKPSSFRASYEKAKKPYKDYIYDGTTFWLVDHQNQSVDQSSAPGGALPAASAFLTNANLANDYAITLSGNKLTLIPKQPSAAVKELDFVVDPQSWTVTESIVIAPSGDIDDFAFTNVSTALIAPGTFAFNAKAYGQYKVTVHAPPAKPAPKNP